MHGQKDGAFPDVIGWIRRSPEEVVHPDEKILLTLAPCMTNLMRPSSSLQPDVDSKLTDMFTDSVVSSFVICILCGAARFDPVFNVIESLFDDKRLQRH